MYARMLRFYVASFEASTTIIGLRNLNARVPLSMGMMFKRGGGKRKKETQAKPVAIPVAIPIAIPLKLSDAFHSLDKFSHHRRAHNFIEQI